MAERRKGRSEERVGQKRRERGEAKKYAMEAMEREKGERSTQLHGIFALHQRAGRLHNGIERNSPGFLFTELIS